MKKIAFFALFTFMVGCNTADKREYYYYLTPDEALDVGYPYGAIVYKSPQEMLIRKIVISSTVVAFHQNSKFVSAKQKTDTNILRRWIAEDIKSFIDTKGYSGELKELKFHDVILPDTLLLKYDGSDSSINYLTNIVLGSPLIQRMEQNNINYWIIQKSNDSLIGPLTKGEFDRIRNEMDIPNSLGLD